MERYKRNVLIIQLNEIERSEYFWAVQLLNCFVMNYNSVVSEQSSYSGLVTWKEFYEVEYKEVFPNYARKAYIITFESVLKKFVWNTRLIDRYNIFFSKQHPSEIKVQSVVSVIKSLKLLKGSEMIFY